MGVKLPDFSSGMLILYSFRTYSLPGPIVECHEDTAVQLPTFRRGGGAPQHLNVTSHIFLRHIDVELCHNKNRHCTQTSDKKQNINRLMATEFKLKNFQKHTAAAATTTIAHTYQLSQPLLQTL